MMNVVERRKREILGELEQFMLEQRPDTGRNLSCQILGSAPAMFELLLSGKLPSMGINYPDIMVMVVLPNDNHGEAITIIGNTKWPLKRWAKAFRDKNPEYPSGSGIMFPFIHFNSATNQIGLINNAKAYTLDWILA